MLLSIYHRVYHHIGHLDLMPILHNIIVAVHIFFPVFLKRPYNSGYKTNSASDEVGEEHTDILAIHKTYVNHIYVQPTNTNVSLFWERPNIFRIFKIFYLKCYGRTIWSQTCLMNIVHLQLRTEYTSTYG